ncbi:MAG: hypothetical protein ABI614_05145 [Planctomycetota bacterium]
MKAMSQAEFANRMDKRPIFLLGAGASMPVLPTVDKIKTALIDFLLANNSLPRNRSLPDRLRDDWLHDTLCKQVEKPHLTLELLCSLFAYRSGVDNGSRRFNAARLWREICQDAQCSVVTFCLAALAETGQIGPILTSNFDCMLYDAMSQLGIAFQIVTDRSLRSPSPAPTAESGEVVAFHGTTYAIDPDDLGASIHSPPTSALARGLATPFSSELSNYINKCLTDGSDRSIICIGYSGKDYYDMNPLLSSLSSAARDRFVWLSYGGIPEDFSEFVSEWFPNSLYAGKADQLLSAYCLDRMPSRRSELLRLEELSSRGDLAQSWRSKLDQVLKSFEIPTDRSDTLISDILWNLPGTFAVLEHYYLYSTAYSESDTLVFGGVRPSEQGFIADHLRFFDLPFDDLLCGQFEYRKEDRKRAELPTLRERTFFVHPETSRIFAPALASIKQKIDSFDMPGVDSMIELLPEYRAVWHVGVAIAYDYLGLVAHKRLISLEALRADLQANTHCSTYQVETRIVEQEVESARTLALAHFGACAEYASMAQDLIEGSRDKLDQWLLEQLVQARTWIMIGKDNLARAARREDSYKLFKDAIEFRRREIECMQEPDYAAAHHSQMWLRASEWLKKILDIRSDQGAFAKELHLNTVEEGYLIEAMKVLEEAYGEYLDVSGKVHRHFLAYYDAKVIYESWKMRAASAQERKESLQPLLENLMLSFNQASEDVKSATERWVQNIHARAKNLAQ